MRTPRDRVLDRGGFSPSLFDTHTPAGDRLQLELDNGLGLTEKAPDMAPKSA